MNSILSNCQAVGSSAYFGERGNWLIATTLTRDSDCLAESNWSVFLRDLQALPEVKDWPEDDSPVQIERFSHWACGWVDYLVVNPACSSAVKAAEGLRERLEDYPALDENDWSERETEAANTVWKNCYRVSERIEYVRSHRSQFEFRSFAEMLSVIRGQYFIGYASELLN